MMSLAESMGFSLTKVLDWALPWLVADTISVMQFRIQLPFPNESYRGAFD
jgi:hypothetical protein